MADPRNELADIVVPLAPTASAAASGASLWWAVAALVGVACVVLAIIVWWVRQRFARSLRAITRAVARQQGSPDVLAGLLDAWARGRFRMVRLEASHGPKAIAADAWADWVNDLSALRFAPVSANAWDALSRLCETARQWKTHV